ncbi:unnamed protein product [Calypogeia fissa]
MNLSGISSAVQACVTVPSYSGIPQCASASVSRSSSSCNSGCPLSASRSQGFGNVASTIRLTDIARSHYVRSPGCEALQTVSFKCAASGNGGDAEPDVSNAAGGELLATSIGNKDQGLVSGSPIVIVEAPEMLKTAEPMPMMRPNRGLIKPGDAGRVIDRRPKDLWAVRFAVGAYLVERKCFKPLDVEL